MRRTCHIAVLFLTCQVAVFAGQEDQGYVLMVSSMHPPVLEFRDEQVKALAATPFDGYSINVIDPYDGSSVPSDEELIERCRHLRSLSGPHIWPRVYGNRMIELVPELKSRVRRNPTYFTAFKGMDIWPGATGLRDFLRLTKVSLRMATTLGAPGIVFDMESYNSGDGYRVQWIAERQQTTAEEVIERLKAVGVQVADLAAEELPEAMLWSLFTTLNRPCQYHESTGTYYTAPAYVFMGLLERAKTKQVPLRLVSGGEWGGYCYRSVEAMRKRFVERNEGFRPWLEHYPNHLVLGATITVWSDANNNRGWVLKDATPETPYRRLADFEPLVAEMFRTYRHVWFYVPSVADYRPLEIEQSSEANSEIRELLRRTRLTSTKSEKETSSP